MIIEIGTIYNCVVKYQRDSWFDQFNSVVVTGFANEEADDREHFCYVSLVNASGVSGTISRLLFFQSYARAVDVQPSGNNEE